MTAIADDAGPPLQLARLSKAIRRNPTIVIGAVLLAGLVAIAVLAPWISGDPFRLSPVNRLRPPSERWWFGTDRFGRDVFALTIYGARVSLIVGLSVALIASAVGLAIGLMCGYFRWVVTPGTALPTEWPKEAFEKHSMEIQARRREIRKRNAPESEMDALFREQQAFEEKLLKSGPHSAAVGAFEGGNYQPRGLYRSQADCIMFTRNRVGFCAACRRAIGRIVDLYSK